MSTGFRVICNIVCAADRSSKGSSRVCNIRFMLYPLPFRITNPIDYIHPSLPHMTFRVSKHFWFTVWFYDLRLPCWVRYRVWCLTNSLHSNWVYLPSSVTLNYRFSSYWVQVRSAVFLNKTLKWSPEWKIHFEGSRSLFRSIQENTYPYCRMRDSQHHFSLFGLMFEASIFAKDGHHRDQHAVGALLAISIRFFSARRLAARFGASTII